MAALAICFGAGVAAGLRIDIPAVWPLAAAALLWAAMACMFARRRNVSPLLFLFSFILGLSAMVAAVPVWYRHPCGAGEYAGVRGTADGSPALGERSVRVILRDIEVLDGGWRPLEGRVALTVYGSVEPARMADLFPSGSRVEGALTLELPPVAQYPGGYDERLRLMVGGIRFEALSGVQGLFVGTSGRPWLREAAGLAGERVREAAGRWIGAQEAAAVLALLTGDKTGLGDPVMESFNRLGAAHLLAVSGMNVGMVLLFTGAMARRFRWGPMTRTLLSAALLGFYYLLTGPQPSMMRALLLWAFVTAGRWAGRRPSPVNSLAAVFALMLLVRPLDILDVGFQLSFLAASAIILLYPPLDARLSRPLRESRKLPRPVRKLSSYALSLLLVTGCVYLVSWPWMARYFGSVAPGAFAANLLLVPYAEAMLVLALAFAALAAVSPVLAGPLGLLLRPVSWLWLQAVRRSAGYSPLLLLPRPPGIALALSGLLALALSPSAVRLTARRRTMAGAALALAVAAACVPWGRFTGGEAKAAAVGDGNAAAVIVERAGCIELLALDRPVFHIQDYWKNRAMPGPRVLVFTGSDAGDLLDVVSDTDLMRSIERLAVPVSLEDDMEALAPSLGITDGLWETASDGWEWDVGGVACRIVCFRAKSEGSVIRTAALLRSVEGSALYIDPQYLREGYEWTQGLDCAVISRMTPSRRDSLRLLGARAVVYADGRGLAMEGAAVLDGSQPVLYNMNETGGVALPEPWN